MCKGTHTHTHINKGVEGPPSPLLLGTRRHHWTAHFCAEVSDGTIQHIDLVEEIHSCKREGEQLNTEWLAPTQESSPLT